MPQENNQQITDLNPSITPRKGFKWRYLILFVVVVIAVLIVWIILFMRSMAPVFIDKTGKVTPPRITYGKEYIEAIKRLRGEGQTPTHLPFNTNAFWMFPIDSSGFAEGVNPVCVKNTLYYLDKNGVIKIERKPAVYGGPFSEGLAAVATTLVPSKDASTNGTPLMTCTGWGFIDHSGKFVIPASYERACSFSENLAMVTINGKIGFIDKAGLFAIQPKYSNARSFSEGLAAVSIENQQWGFIDNTGTVVIPIQFDWADSFSQGFAPVQEQMTTGNGKWGYIDKSGHFVIPPKYASAKPFSEDLAAVAIGGAMYETWGYINTSGEFQIRPKYMIAHPFEDGLAIVARKSPAFERITKVSSLIW